MYTRFHATFNISLLISTLVVAMKKNMEMVDKFELFFGLLVIVLTGMVLLPGMVGSCSSNGVTEYTTRYPLETYTSATEGIEKATKTVDSKRRFDDSNSGKSQIIILPITRPCSLFRDILVTLSTFYLTKRIHTSISC